MLKRIATAAATCVLMAPAAFAQLSPTAEWATHAQNQYAVQANITYLTASGYESKLDIYRRRDVQTPQPTLVFYHGGGWVGGTKEASFMSLMPWFEMGWSVVNVEYRMARVALAPAAVEDARCALRWVIHNAREYNVDTERIIVTGQSAGSHLALMTGLVPESAGFDRTLASLEKRPITIGVSYEAARLDTIYPQPWDIPMDYVVTERGVYRRDPEGLACLGEPQRGDGSKLASPVCYADEVQRD